MFSSEDKGLVRRIIRMASAMLAVSAVAGAISAYVPFAQPGVNFPAMWAVFLSAAALWALLVFTSSNDYRPVLLIPSTVLGLVLIVVGQYLVAGDRGTFISLVYLVLIFGSAFYRPRQILVLSICTAFLVGLPAVYDYDVDFLRRWIQQVPVMISVGYFASVVIHELKRSRQERDELAAIAEAGQVSTTLDLQATLKATVEQLRRVVRADACIFYLLQDDELVVRAAVMDPVVFPEEVAAKVRTHRTKVSNGLTGWVAQHGEPIVTGDAENDPRAGHVPGTPYEIQSYVVFPMKVEDRIIGVINTIKAGRDRFGPELLRIVSIFANQAAVAIENARLYEETRALAATDSLTGLRNWRYVGERLQDELESAPIDPGSAAADPAADSVEASVIMMDCDQFKAVNDHLGHLNGDALLRELGRTIEGILSGDQVLGRYAGDEFVIFLPKTGAKEAARIAEAIRKAVSDAEFVLGGTSIRMTISLGVATYPTDGSNTEALLQAADHAMYRAKMTGGNFVAVSAEVA
ncbi:MAG TPA: sensor domain-containing diguanylate cyclase [Bacillota bacterium]